MSLRHLVLLRFHEGTDPAEVEAVVEALRALPAAIPELVDYRVGADLGLSEGAWDLGIAADFATADDFTTYREHPDHLRVIRELITPLVADRAAIQYAT
jgi:hypothetical protein